MIIGTISDTHGLIRDEVYREFNEVDHIIHAGDIGKIEVADKLEAIAPLSIIRGNVDTGLWAKAFPFNLEIELEGRKIYVVHNIADLNVDPSQYSAIIYGHSHIPKAEIKDDVLYFNPGSAGPRRFKLPVSIGKLHIGRDNLLHELIRLV